MKIAIQCRGIPLTDAIAARVHKRLGFLLGHGISRLQAVDVSLSRFNSPRGGIDTRCLVKIHIYRLPCVSVEEVQPELYRAIDRATERAARTALRRLALDNSSRRMEAHRWLAKQRKHQRRSSPTVS